MLNHFLSNRDIMNRKNEAIIRETGHKAAEIAKISIKDMLNKNPNNPTKKNTLFLLYALHVIREIPTIEINTGHRPFNFAQEV